MSARPIPFVSPEEYLQAERAAPFKSEYYSGQTWAMSSVSREHDRIAVNLTVAITLALRGGPCQPFTSDMRVTAGGTLFTYPDFTVVCGEPEFSDAAVDTLMNPTVLFEILSPSTENYDRTAKFGKYRLLLSLREYVLLHQDRLHAERFERHGEIWATYEYVGPDAVLELSSVGISLPLSALYEGVALALIP